MPSAFSIIFPPSPQFTDANLPSLAGKVYIVTGAASGVGFELAKILYAAGGTVYIAARSVSRCTGAVEKIKAQVGNGKKLGRLENLVIDLADLSSVKGPIEGFLQKESRLDVLVHNAGVMTPPVGSKDALGHDLEIGTNCLAPYLLTALLEPLLTRTASTSQAFGVRIIWVVSMMQMGTPRGGMVFDESGSPMILKKAMDNYMQTKVGGAWLAAEFANRLGGHGILSVSVHPGLMRTELQRNWPAPTRIIMGILLKPPTYGAYSELYAGFSPDLRAEHNGGFVTAWGRVADMPYDIANGLKSQSEGGSGAAAKFLKYCDREVKLFL